MTATAKQSLGVEPFLKWAGGKRQLLDALKRHLPRDLDSGRYHEPFLGSGALFFALRPQNACLSDTNADLILAYRVVQQQLDALVERLSDLARAHKTSPRETYYSTRAAYNRKDDQDEPHRAARLIYLNRTCFNGLYRVNRRGEFNVPMGSYRNPSILQYERLVAANDALSQAELRCVCYSEALANTEPSDFVYVDPPYIPVSRTANFTAYTDKSFSLEHQKQLADHVASLAEGGTRVLVSNAEHPHVRELYADHKIVAVKARRSINSRGDRRGRVGEVLVLAGYRAPRRRRSKARG